VFKGMTRRTHKDENGSMMDVYGFDEKTSRPVYKTKSLGNG
jgi:hypothetical protein